MVWKYHDPKNGGYLEELKASTGFADKYALEKLVLDFEMHYRLKSEFKMVVRGGMAAILHERAKLQRISEDMDVLTPVPKPQILSIMERLNAGSGEMKSALRASPRAFQDTLSTAASPAQPQLANKHALPSWTYCAASTQIS